MISNHYNHIAANQPPRQLHAARRREHNLAKQQLLEWLRDRGLRPAAVVDLACGRGGDLHKIAATFETCTSYVGADVSEASVGELMRRAGEMGLDSAVQAHVCDAACVPVAPASADLVTMNFALHYFADAREHMAALLDKAASVLRAGGVFAGTCVDWRQLRAGPHAGFCTLPSMFDGIEKQPWGRKYRFQLQGCVDADEYVVHWPTIVSMAHERGLHLVRFRGLNGFLYSMGHNPTCPADNAPYAVFAFIRI